MGQSVARLEDPRLLTGRGRYVANMTPPGTGHVAFARSTRARARITRLDVTAAASLDGVWGAWTATDLNGEVGSLRGSLVLPGGGGPPDHLLADGDVRFVGDPVAVIVAASPAAAADATGSAAGARPACRSASARAKSSRCRSRGAGASASGSTAR